MIFFFDNDEKVAFLLKHTHIKARVQNPYSIYDQNSEKPYPLEPGIRTEIIVKGSVEEGAAVEDAEKSRLKASLNLSPDTSC